MTMRRALLLAAITLVLVPTITLAQNAQVIGLELIEGGSSRVVASLFDGVIITVPSGTTPNFGVKAITTGSPISSVVFGLNNVTQYRVETSAPYALCGNDGPLFFRCSRLMNGTHDVSATISNTGSTVRFRFQIVYGAAPTSPVYPVATPILPPTLLPVVTNPPKMTFHLIYTPNNTEVMRLESGSIIDLSRFPTPEFNVKADTIDPLVKSIRFMPIYQDETFRPFAYCGNVGPQYNACPSFASPGLKTITVEPFTERFQSGEQLPSVVLTFTIRSGTMPGTAAPISLPMLTPVAAPIVPPILSPTKSPIALSTNTPIRLPTNAPIPLPTNTPLRSPTGAPTRAPTNNPIAPPTTAPVQAPTKMPIPPLTIAPTLVPTNTPVVSSTTAPIRAPTNVPSLSPIPLPTNAPITKSPTVLPSKAPTRFPTGSPTEILSVVPTEIETSIPTKSPTNKPTRGPTQAPVLIRTLIPTKRPTIRPTIVPTKNPTRRPTIRPTKSPTGRPITLPTNSPTRRPTIAPAPIASAGRNITLTLVYTPDNTDVVQLVEGMIINASNFEKLSFNIRADSTSENIKSVRFFPIDRGETSKPWAYCGNDGPLYTTCADFTSRGNFIVTARPFSETGTKGIQYPDVILRFSIVGATTPNIGFPMRINCGGPTVTDSRGQKWTADSFFSGGTTYSTSSVEIANTQDDVIYRSERSGTFVYNIPVPLGSYSVILHFAEITFTMIGQRVFDMDVEGTLIADIDIIDRAEGRSKTPLVIDAPVAVADGFLTIRGITNVPKLENAKISAIEVIVVGPHYAHAVTGGPYTAVDSDNDGFENVPVDATESHTHGPNEVLSDFVWRRGNAIIGNGEITTLRLPTGRHIVTLTATDSSGDSNTDTTIITVLTAEFPSLTSISPNNGFLGGGTQVTISGSGFATVFGLRFGQVVLTSRDFTIVDSNTIVALSPFSGVSVPAAVSVMNPAGESNSRSFTYLSSVPIRFNFAKLLDMEDPTAVAFGPDSKLYVGNLKGQLAKYTLNDSFDAVLSTVITTVDSRRGIHGITFDPLDDADTLNPTVYIATSDIFHNEARNSIGDAVTGKIQTVRGANLDIVVDIVTGLPVSGLDHSVNGIYFGNDGELYIGVGSNTNGGIPGELTRNLLMRESYLSAAILVANIKKPNFNGFITYSAPNDGDPVTGTGPDGVEVFASGTRNPFGVVMHSNGKIYATDNGPNPGFGDMATGCGAGQIIPDVYDSDKLNLIVRGNYYGHPNHKRGATDPRQCIWRGTSVASSAQSTAPLMKLRSSTNGLIEYEASYFGNEMRGNLIASKYKDGLFRIVLAPDGNSVAAYSNPAIELSGDGGLAVTQTPNGNLIDARYETNECFVYRPEEPPTALLKIYSIFPRRGKMQGGSTLSIYGSNFASTINVLISGLVCTNVIFVSTRLIKCTLPPSPSVGQKTIEVYKGSEQTAFVDGYRYILGRPQ